MSESVPIKTIKATLLADSIVGYQQRKIHATGKSVLWRRLVEDATIELGAKNSPWISIDGYIFTFNPDASPTESIQLLAGALYEEEGSWPVRSPGNLAVYTDHVGCTVELPRSTIMYLHGCSVPLILRKACRGTLYSATPVGTRAHKGSWDSLPDEILAMIMPFVPITTWKEFDLHLLQILLPKMPSTCVKCKLEGYSESANIFKWKICTDRLGHYCLQCPGCESTILYFQ